MRIRQKQILDQEAVDIVQPRILILIAKEQYASLLETEGEVRLRKDRKAVDRGVAGRIAELIDRVSIFVNPLNDTECPLIERRAEKPRDRRIALILCRDRQRRESVFLLPKEPRVDKIQLGDLSALAPADTRAALPKAAEEIEMAKIKEPIPADVRRKSAAIGCDPLILFDNAHDNVHILGAVRTGTCAPRLCLDQTENITGIKILLAEIDIRLSEQRTFLQNNCFSDAFGLCILISGNENSAYIDGFAFVFYRVDYFRGFGGSGVGGRRCVDRGFTIDLGVIVSGLRVKSRQLAFTVSNPCARKICTHERRQFGHQPRVGES